MITGIQKKIADKFMRMTIYKYVKKLVQKGTQLTVEEIMQSIKEESLATLVQQGYTVDEITEIVSEIIGREKKWAG